MEYRLGVRAVLVSSIALLASLLGCSEDIFIGSRIKNRPPEVWLSSGPVEGDTTSYQVHFYWGGWDPDGEIRAFEFVIVDGSPFGFDGEDTTGLDKWRRTAAFDSVFKVKANAVPRDVRYGNSLFTRYDLTHTFFIRSIDVEGKRSLPVFRSFTAWTLAPYIQFTSPKMPSSGTISTLARVITFCWQGKDPIDSPDNVQDPDSVRYLYHMLITPTGEYDPSFDLVGDLNGNPERYEGDWSRWISYRAPEDSGKCTILGDDEILEMNQSYIFAVQAKDEAGAVTAVFDRRTNVRQFIVSLQAGPLLKITETYLGGFVFLGTNLRPAKRDLPPGVVLNFNWSADASSYGGEIVCFQYGWDVADVNDPGDWASDCSPYVRGCTMAWYSGVHTLFVRVFDNAGGESLGQIEINIVPFFMDRNLLWVDDFPSSNFVQDLYAMPREDEHDAFWLGLCNRATGFDAERDVYDAYYSYNRRYPPIAYIGRYRNIIWTFSNASDMGAWDDIVVFTPESLIGQGTKLTVNYLSIFLSKGGHLLTEGRSDRGGGLAAVLAADAQVFPLNLRCEITGPTEGCEGDTSGVNSMAYRDYCVTMIDKVLGVFRGDSDMPTRWESIDGLSYAKRDALDPLTALHPGLPDSLGLWEEVVKPGRYFDPRIRGYTFVEIYDPAYWMSLRQVTSQPCFHPMYRMRSRNTVSPVHRAAVAIWSTKYAEVDPDGETGTGVAAPSAHLGFELWYFNRAEVNALIDDVFDAWDIGAY